MQRGVIVIGLIEDVFSNRWYLPGITVEVRQRRTIVEGAPLDFGHAAGNGDRSQAAALIESVRSNGFHAVGDLDGSQAAAL